VIHRTMKLSDLYKGCPGMGGRLGGSIVFVHDIRVLQPVDEPPERVVAPVAHPEKEEAAA